MPSKNGLSADVDIGRSFLAWIPFIFLLADEQLYVETWTGQYVVNGPGLVFVIPLSRVQRRRSITLANDEYVHIRNRFTGSVKCHQGPMMVFLAADECVGQIGKGTQVGPEQYVRVSGNKKTGAPRHIAGPTLYIPDVDDESHRVLSASKLSSAQFCHVQSAATGRVRLVKGPALFFPAVDETLVVEQGTAVAVKKQEYLTVLDQETGKVEVVHGEALFFPLPSHTVLDGGPKRGVNVDSETAVLVRDRGTGQQRLIKEKQLYRPTAEDVIVEERKVIRMEPYHAAVVLDNRTGGMEYRKGPLNFFLEPHTQLLHMNWSTGLRKESRNLRITLFDTRPHFMWYDFEARTKDNVELSLSVTFFWSAADLKAMVATTDDAPGDICSHARSTIIQAVSLLRMEEFLQSFNRVVTEAVMGSDLGFYSKRGCEIFEVEVRAVECKDRETQAILNAIIQEQTNRMNRLQKQESENEVRVRKVAGEIEAERMNAELLAVKTEHSRITSEMEGAAEATRVAAFLRGIAADVPKEADRLEVFRVLRKGEALGQLAKGSSKLFFTPSDVDLKIAA